MTPIFTSTPLPVDLQKTLIRHNIWNAGCPVPLERLRLLTLTYVDFAGLTHNDGQMVVLDAVADAVIAIFQKLYTIRFPIEHIAGIEAYLGNDEHSMADNNSSCFNFREITGGGSLPSIHSYGLAIDINPVQNPYISPRDTKILPAEGWNFINRHHIRPGMAEPIVEIFYKYGFTIWGGTWNEPIDWQHFQPPRAISMLLVAMDPDDAKHFFAHFTHSPTIYANLTCQDTTELIVRYRQDPSQFMQLHASGI